MGTRACIGGALAASFALMVAGSAGAVGSLSTGGHEPLEQRLALALGPERTVLWTQLRVQTLPGALAIVAPARAGDRLDWSSDAFFEALEAATAPRVLPPEGISASCPGEPPPSDAVIDTGNPYHVQPLAPLEVFLAADAAELIGWAELHGMMVSAAAASALSATAGPFVAARFLAPDGEALTPALRIAGDGPSVLLPLVLSESGASPLRVTSFVLAEGRMAFDGPIVGIAPADLNYGVAEGTTNYDALRMSTLSHHPLSWLLEASSRQAFVGGLSIEKTPHHLPGLVQGYFLRAAVYEDGISASACVSQAESALAVPAPIAQSCIRGELGAVGTADACTETPLAGQVDPSSLRCGLGAHATTADDLAVALAGQTASAVWLTRASMRIAAGATGESRLVSPSPGAAVDPILEAGKLDLNGCDGETTGVGSSGAGGSPGGSTTATGGSTQVPVYYRDSGCGSPSTLGAPIYYVEVDDEEAPDAYYYDNEDCGGDTSESYAAYEGDGYDDDDCGGDSAESYENDDCGGDSAESYENDDCGGDSSDGYDDDDCGGDSSDGYESDDCGGDSSDGYDDDDRGGDSSTGGDSSYGNGFSDASRDDCSIGRRRHRTRLSPLVMGALFVVFPLRRLTRPRRRRLK